MASKLPSLRSRVLPSGARQFYAYFDGRQVALGTDEDQARERFDRVLGVWLGNGRQLPQGYDPEAELATVGGLTVSQVAAAYLRHARGYYRTASGKPTSELDNVAIVVRDLRRLFGATPAKDFGPARLGELRQAWIKAGMKRSTINQKTGKVKRLLRWAAEQELIPGEAWYRVQAVKALQKGRSDAVEPEAKEAVPFEAIRAVLASVPAEVGAMIRTCLLTGARPGEVASMRVGEVDEEAGEYRPTQHKGSWRDDERCVALSAAALDVLEPYLLRARGRPDGVVWLTRRGEQASTASLRKAIWRGCDRAGIPRWSPHRLRHTSVTTVDLLLDNRHAQDLAGHKDAQTTVRYSKKARGKRSPEAARVLADKLREEGIA